MQSPPSIPGRQMVSENYQTDKQNQHFMQDVIERKIEKFSTQNINVQKRVNTSSKFRNNSHMMIGAPQMNVPPGSSGSQG